MVGIIGILMYAAAVFIIFQCIFVYIPLVYPRYAASLFAGNDFSRSAFAFAFILFSRFIFVNLGIGKGVTVLAGLSVLGIVSVDVCSLIASLHRLSSMDHTFIFSISLMRTNICAARNGRTLLLRW